MNLKEMVKDTIIPLRTEGRLWNNGKKFEAKAHAVVDGILVAAAAVAIVAAKELPGGLEAVIWGIIAVGRIVQAMTAEDTEKTE